MSSSLWNQLFLFGPQQVKQKPATNLYGLIVKDYSMNEIHSFLEGGHDINATYRGGSNLSLSLKYLSLIDFKTLLSLGLNLTSVLGVNPLAVCIDRIMASDDIEVLESEALLKFLLLHEDCMKLKPDAFIHAASKESYTSAVAIIESGLDIDSKIQVGPNDFISLSQRLLELKKQDFADLLLGNTVDIEHLKSKENKERQLKLKMEELLNPCSNVDEAFLTATSQEMKRLITEINNGTFDDVIDDKWRDRWPLEFACSNNLNSLASTLIGRQICQEHLREGVMVASRNGMLDLIKIAKNNGYNFAKEKKRKGGPLLEAASFGHVQVVSYLLDNGANKEQTDSNSETALMLTESHGGRNKNEILQLLS